MACGLAVVASPVGVHKEIICHGVNGLLARTETDWIDHLTRLQAEPQLRQRLGAMGRKTVLESYSLHKICPQIASILKSVVFRQRSQR